MDRDHDYEQLHAMIASVEAPLRLRERIADEQRRHAVRGPIVKRMKLTGALAGFAAALGVAVALIAPSGNSTGPTAAQLAGLAGSRPAAAAPAPDPADPQHLQAKVDTVSFPRWSQHLRWRATGSRTDSVRGRDAVTVFYDNPRGVRLGYTILSGKAVAWTAGARVVTSNGVEVHVHRANGRVIAEWREHDHSCVISAPASVPDQTMILLASHDYAS